MVRESFDNGSTMSMMADSILAERVSSSDSSIFTPPCLLTVMHRPPVHHQSHVVRQLEETSSCACVRRAWRRACWIMNYSHPEGWRRPHGQGGPCVGLCSNILPIAEPKIIRARLLELKGTHSLFLCDSESAAMILDRFFSTLKHTVEACPNAGTVTQPDMIHVQLSQTENPNLLLID